MSKLGSARIVSYACRTSAGDDIDALWRAICAGRSSLAHHELDDTRFEHPRFNAISLRQDPAQVLLRVCRESLRKAQAATSSLKSRRTMLFAGSSLGGMQHLERQHRGWWLQSKGESPDDETFAQGCYAGPTTSTGDALGVSSVTLNTACSSAANAMGLARLWLCKKRIDIAIVAGYDFISSFVYAGFDCLGAIDSEVSRPFCNDRAGLNLGEAALACVLIRSTDASEGKDQVDVVGFGSTCDAHHITRPDPDGRGLARAIGAALDDAGGKAPDVDALSAHGTGTYFNDAMEAAAFRSVFGEGDAIPPVHCAKSVTGHTLGAAGLVDAFVVAAALRHQTWPASLMGAPDPKLGAAPSKESSVLCTDALVLSTSSGFGGSNAALLFRGAADE